MLLDNVTFSILVGITLLIIYILVIRKLPNISKAIIIFISGQSFTYGLFFVMYGITADIKYLFEDRWMIGFGGFALLWVGIESFISSIKEDRQEQMTETEDISISSLN